MPAADFDSDENRFLVWDVGGVYVFKREGMNKLLIWREPHTLEASRVRVEGVKADPQLLSQLKSMAAWDKDMPREEEQPSALSRLMTEIYYWIDKKTYSGEYYPDPNPAHHREDVGKMKIIIRTDN